MTRPSHHRAIAFVAERAITPLAKKFWQLVPKGKIFGSLVAASLIVCASASAAELVGTVRNGTTKKPSRGDDVVLLTLSPGAVSETPGAKTGAMSETARTKTDGAGRFSFAVPDARASYIVRVLHQGVVYEKIVDPRLTIQLVLVYDVVDNLDGVAALMDVQRFEARNDTLEVKQLITMHNASKPPRTLMNDRPFEIQLPPEAQVLSGVVQPEDAEPLKQKPLSGDHKGEYYFHSPLRPGDTRFAVVYRVPYNGEAVFEPRIRNAQERFVIMLPQSMRFEPQAAGIFNPMPDVSPDNVVGTAPVTTGQTLAFRVSGTGMLKELQGRQPPSRTEVAQPTSQLDSGFHTSVGPSRRDNLILAGLGVGLLAFSIVFIAKRRPVAQPSVEQELLSAQSQRAQQIRRHKRRVRVSQKYSYRRT